jgi:acyl-CoA synthetase (AMP-forming)/AMP-acid ligase II
VGRAFSCCEIRIEGEDGSVLGHRVIGEVCVRGSNVMKGYFRKPEATAHALRGGWLHTGDLGYLDDDGFLNLTGMKKRMINVSGKKVYPAEVERLLRQHPSVQAVEIFAKPAPTQNQSVQGRVRLRTPGPEAQDEFTAWCTKRISDYKLPRRPAFL